MEKLSLLSFFEVLSSKIQSCLLPKNKVSRLDSRRSNLFNSAKIAFIVLAFFGAIDLFGQTFPPATSCTSKDLLLVNATMPSTPCETCSPESPVTKELTLYINNKTGSTRTSFAFWATLTVINSDGTKDVANSKSISGCYGPIPKNATTAFIYGTITFKCGQSLQLTDIWEAWTDAAPNSTCATLTNSTSTINPKCGTLPVLNVIAGLDAILSSITANCSNAGGSITVTPQGGTSPYTVTLVGSPNIVRTVTTGSTTFSNLASGDYTINLSDANKCPNPVIKTPHVSSTGVSTAPSVTTPVVYCQNATASALTATGTGLLWYTTATGGTGNSTAPTPATTSAGNTSYWVSQTTSGNCESPRAEIVVTVNGTPSAPIVSTPVVYCQNSIASALTATGTGLLWYTTATGGIGSSTAPTPSTLTAGNTSYWVSQTIISNSLGCESPRAQIVVTVNATASAPTVSVVNNCDGSSDLTASNYTGSLLWSNGETTASIHVTNAATYSVTQTVNGCISATGSATSAPRITPDAPTVSVVNNCDGSSDLTASNYTGSLLWNTGAITSSIHVTDAATYTVTQTVNDCVSASGSGTSAPKTTPSAPTVNVNNNCDGSSDLIASNYTGSLLWSNGETTASIHVTNAATYSVTQTVDGCVSANGSGTSAPRTTPDAPTVSVVNNCDGSSDLTASNYSGSLVWSTGATSTSIHVTDAATYTVTQTVNDCVSASGSGTSAPWTTPEVPTLCVVQPSLCSSIGSITVLSPTGEGYQYSIDNGKNWQTDTLFDNLAAGSNPSIIVQSSQGCISSSASSCDASDCSETAPVAKLEKTADPEAKKTEAIVPVETTITSKTENVGFDAYPVPFKDQLTIKYKFDYVSDVLIEMFDINGTKVISKVDSNSYLDKEVVLDYNFNRGSQQVYIVRLTTNQGHSEQKVLSSY